MNNYSRLSGATALSARTARACESCLKRRARWFCPADDAFLCHPCDSSVHSANELAGRHTRVRLSSSSSSSSTSTSSSNLNNPITHPTWHRGFTRKARTPRRWNKKNQNDYCGPVVPTATTTLLVPEMESEVVHQEESGVCFDDGRYYSIINGIEEKDHLELGGFSVPVLDEDPFDREVAEGGSIEHEFDFSLVDFMGSEDHKDPSWDILPGFDLASLEDDVGATVELEKLVVKDECEVVDYWDMEIFGSGSNSIVKQEEKKKGNVVVMEKDEYGSGGGGEGGGWLSDDNNNNNDKKRRKLMMLQLNYDEVIQEWNKQGCPAWSAGHVDHLTIDAWSSSSYATTWQGGGGLSKDMGHEGHHHQQQGNSCRHQDDADGGRGARVMRYREKRKNRLFAKKIRYQVRKLNAEMRPRLKGRFVKRTVSTSGSVIPTPTMTMTFPRRHSSFPSPPTGATGLGLGIGVGPSHH